jgi:hypothetical protein
MMRYFAVTNGGDKIVGLAQFDADTMTAQRYKKSTQQWEDDGDVMAIVTGRDNDAWEVDEAEADRIRTEVLAPVT